MLRHVGGKLILKWLALSVKSGIAEMGQSLER